METIPLVERNKLRKEAQETIKKLDDYEKQYDVVVYFWARGKNKKEAVDNVEKSLQNCRMTYNIGEVEEVEY